MAHVSDDRVRRRATLAHAEPANVPHQDPYILPQDRIRADVAYDPGKREAQAAVEVKRIRGQLDSVERRIQEEATCAAILQQATACRGALDGFIAEVIEDHFLEHLVDPSARRDDPRAQAAEELVEIVHSYFK